MTSYQGLQLQIPTQQSLTFAEFDALTNPLVSYKFNEPSGTTVINYGSLGSGNGVWTPGMGAVGQAGLLGAGHAYLYDKLDSVVTGPTSTSINNVTVLTVAMLVKATSNGEGGAGYLWADNGGNRILAINAGTDPVRLAFSLWCTSGYATVTADASSGMALNKWYWVFAEYDNSAASRVPHIYLGADGQVTECGYSASTPAPAALSNASGAMKVGNNSSSIRTWDGPFDEFRFYNRLLTLEEKRNFVQLSAA